MGLLSVRSWRTALFRAVTQRAVVITLHATRVRRDTQNTDMGFEVTAMVQVGLLLKIEALCVAGYETAGFWNIMMYLLTAIGLSPGGSTHLHTNNT